ncbi:hypothetical protein IQ07DRAFT_502245 [Pyrenochaeta sp. DS3sAY3a]|nr:hypothetical protein IQ07DRAFT_502245 [Pyrenochaeta sp. DS3sAY3a]
MWRMGLLYLDRGDSAIFAALKDAGHNNNRQPPGSPSGKFNPNGDAEHGEGKTLRHDLPNGAPQWAIPQDASGLKFARPSSSSGNPLDSLSPSSDNPMFEEPEVYSLDRSREEANTNFRDYFAAQDAQKDRLIKSDGESPPLQPRRVRHRPRAPSSVSFTTGDKPSVPFPARTKTNEGLLQLHMGAEVPKSPQLGDSPKTPRFTTPVVDRHRRKVSLGLPLRSLTGRPDSFHHPNIASICGAPPDTPPQTPATDRATSNALKQRERELAAASQKQKERDLEYKHRHTFIGTASLDDFLEVLDISPQHMTTKASVVRAFVVLASSERLLARQASATPNGWDLVSRIASDMTNNDYLVQAHIKLGSITLGQFMDLIYFDEREEASALSVTEAFSAASHLDSKNDGGTGSRARSFRSWMAQQS